MTQWTPETAWREIEQVYLIHGQEYALESARDWIADLLNAGAPEEQVAAFRAAKYRLLDAVSP